MTRMQRLVAPVFATLALAALVGIVLTTNWRETAAPAPSGPGPSAPSPVDLQLLNTAQSLAPLASTSEEHAFSQEALRLADHEVDLAFASALRAAAEHSVAADPRVRAIQERLQKAQSLVAADQQRIAALTASLADAPANKKDALDEELELLKSALELDKDDAEDAQEDLTRAGGDPKAKIQKLVDEHEASQRATAGVSAAPPPPASGGLAGKIQDYFRTAGKVRQIHAAQREAETETTTLTARHEEVEKQVETERSKLPALANRSASAPAISASSDRGALLQGTKHLAIGQQHATSLDKRIADSAQLAAVYYRWSTLARTHRQSALRSVLLGVLWIALLIVLLHYLRMWLDHLLARFTTDQRFQASLRILVRTTIDIFGLVTILLLLFGQPGQMATAVGLIGAGLTVALKDFVVAFVGWFRLMGRNGIRAGDWVEIDGVRGEVAEVGMFRTVLLETLGESGHPTGRRVSLSNSFAIEKHFFNFTTLGQWLWDEIRCALPADRDAQAILDVVRKRVTEETAESARQAETEWSESAGSSTMRAFSAQPAVSLRPGLEGMDAVVRYATRATERSRMRGRLYQVVVEAIQKTTPQEVKAD
jgi:small-conductance mechanosensitive channel